ncbi:MAG: gamma-glutamyltransferase, partial [Candidatus Bathyarchaeota archaeon]|nr:gamma-glutamyltransferase [Candidatus Bathyarchaeota archaeon]
MVVAMWFNSRRSPVYGTRGAVASSQPLASEAGMRILQGGGNAADAAVAVAAALNVTEPCSTGMGGDCFALYWDASKGRVLGLNGSGRAPAGLTPEKLLAEGFAKMPTNGVHTVTVPGAVAGWVDTIEHFGTLTMKDVLAPAIELAEGGYPVSPLTARAWANGVHLLKSGPYGDEMLINGRAPGAGEIMRNPTLAHSMREVVEHGKAGFYEGRVAEAIVELLHLKGGTMTLEDLKRHQSTFDEPITVNYRGVDIWEIPPNGQGITALIALNIVEGYDLSKLHHDSPQRLHLLIEAIRTAFADTRWYVADPSVTHVPIKELISKDYAAERRQHINPSKATLDRVHGSPVSGSDTVYFCTVDRWGNACSFINSNYAGFGTGLIPGGCGFTLQNRGAGFSLDKSHPNVLAPGKRPYHTIIPGMMTKNGELHGPFGVMGGFMQPQGHLQVVTNMVDYGMDPQEALNSPRFCILDGTAGGKVSLEEGIPVETMAALARMGHEVIPVAGPNRVSFGKGQIILRNPKTGALTAGSDPRGDGQALG